MLLMQVYMDNVADLLAKETPKSLGLGGPTGLRLTVHDNAEGRVVVQGLTEVCSA